jgi:hypothetical protein
MYGTLLVRIPSRILVTAATAAPRPSDSKQARRQPRPPTKKDSRTDLANSKSATDAADDGKHEWLAKVRGSSSSSSNSGGISKAGNSSICSANVQCVAAEMQPFEATVSDSTSSPAVAVCCS